MADPRKQAARLGAEAMLDAGKDAARKLYDDLTLSDEEKAKREAERAAAKKRRNRKWIAYGVVALLALVMVMMLLAKVGPYLLGLAVVAVLGFLVWRRVRPRGRKSEVAADDVVAEGEARPATRIEAPPARQRVADDPETIATRAAASAAAKAQAEHEIDEELAALKRKARE